LRLRGIEQSIEQSNAELGINLKLVDMGTQTGGTFPIHTEMYNAISSSDIIVIDLTGVRPNVCVEAGFALRNHEKNRLIFLFQPTEGHPSVPFDLNTFRYETFTDTGQIPDKLKPNIAAIITGT
jgi:methyl coenzyme M reductase subunit C